MDSGTSLEAAVIAGHKEIVELLFTDPRTQIHKKVQTYLLHDRENRN